MDTYQYHVGAPDGYDAGSTAASPLIVFLHGYGEIGFHSGRTLEQQVKRHGPWKDHGCTDYAQKHNLVREKIGEFFIVAPHLLAKGEWEPEKLMKTLDEFLLNPKYSRTVDTNRVYLTGISWGGRGALRWTLEEPTRFAAVALVCAYGGAEFRGRIHVLKDLPLRLYHGKKDGCEKPDKPPDPKRFASNSKKLEARLKAHSADARVEFILYPDAGHAGAWILAYKELELYEWFLQHRKDGMPTSEQRLIAERAQEGLLHRYSTFGRQR